MSAASVIGFRGIHGHARACDFLRSAVAHERLAHAMLFAGPEGVGKRSVALALAAWLLCECPGEDACGTCASCRQVAAGSHPDLQVITVAPGKKEIGVDRARELKRFTQLQPMRGKGKVGIVDDAHMLTVAAQNALLKTLEEPPSRSVLILIANNPDAMLATVRSRCQRVQFFPLPIDVVVDILTTRHGIDKAAAGALAGLAEGSPGRALALGKSALSGTGERLRQQLAGLATARYVALMQLASELGQPDNQVAVRLELLLAQYRDEALRAVGAAHLALTPPPTDADAAVRTALRRAELVDEAWHAVRRGNPNRQLLLEALLLRLARA